MFHLDIIICSIGIVVACTVFFVGMLVGRELYVRYTDTPNQESFNLLNKRIDEIWDKLNDDYEIGQQVLSDVTKLQTLMSNVESSLETQGSINLRLIGRLCQTEVALETLQDDYKILSTGVGFMRKEVDALTDARSKVHNDIDSLNVITDICQNYLNGHIENIASIKAKLHLITKHIIEADTKLIWDSVPHGKLIDIKSKKKKG